MDPKHVGISLIFMILSSSLAEKKCLDHKSKIVHHGDRYFPMGSDPCTQCTCANGNPEMCIAVFCSPPENCRQYHALNDKCCEFRCDDSNLPHFPNIGVNITDDNKDPLAPTNLGLRLVASAVTSFLILALLLFMIHRLRQRRLLLVIRRLNGHRLDTAPSGGQRYSHDDDSNVGYFVGHDQLDFAAYDEPPPPYSFWKPPETYIPTGEAPPPYEMTIRYPPPAIVLSPSSNADQNGHPFPQPDHVFINASRSPINNHLGTDSSMDGRNSISPGIQSSVRSNSLAQSDSSDYILEDMNNVTVLQINGGATTNSTPSGGLCEDDIVNGNVLLSGSVQDSCSTASSVSKSRESRSGNRCHSYCEGLGQWREEQTSQKQPLVTGSNNNVFPDPTSWVGEGSESSTTTSPSSATVSPTSSDSSPDAPDFTRRNNLQDKHSSSGASGGGCVKKTAYQPVKRNSLERTIKHLKRFSLPGKLKSKSSDTGSGESSRREAKPEQNSAFVSEGSCSTSPQSAEDNPIPPVSTSTTSTTTNSSSRTNDPRCKQYRNRPASLNLNSWYIASSNANRGPKSTTTSESSQHCSTASSADSIPVDNVIIPTNRRINSAGGDASNRTLLMSDTTPSSVGPAFRLGYLCSTDSQGHLHALQQQRRVVARSSSICSETGEHNPRRLSIPIGRSYRHSSDSTPEYPKNFNSSPSSQQNASSGESARDYSLRVPMEQYRRSSESSNSGT